MLDTDQNEEERGREEKQKEASSRKQEKESEPKHRGDSARTGRPLISGARTSEQKPQ